MVLNWIVSNRLSMECFLPELLLIGGALGIFVLESFVNLSRKVALTLGLIIFIGFTALAAQNLGEPTRHLFSGMMVQDQLSAFFKVIFGMTAILVSYMMYSSKDLKDYGLSEVFASLMVIMLGLSAMASATDLLMAILSIEMVSVISYILVGFRKQHRASSEAGLKYLLYGAVASGTMAFGLSFLFGLIGSTSFMDMRQYFAELHGISTAPVVLFALLTVAVGIGYKMATFPAQMWCPDVYEGAPLPVTTFLSVAPKAAGFAMLSRFLFTIFVTNEGHSELIQFIQWPVVLSILAAITMTLGNLGALVQRNLKRLFAYSSIAHAGYLLMGVACLSTFGLQALCFYFIAYLFMNIGAFYMVYYVSNQIGSEDIDSLSGLAWKSPLFSVVFSIFLFSLIGLPPCMGFIGKYLVFSAAIQKGLYLLASIAVINTAIALYYYAGLMKKMFFNQPSDQVQLSFSGAARWIVFALALPTIIFGLYWSPLLLDINIEDSQTFSKSISSAYLK